MGCFSPDLLLFIKKGSPHLHLWGLSVWFLEFCSPISSQLSIDMPILNSLTPLLWFGSKVARWLVFQQVSSAFADNALPVSSIQRNSEGFWRCSRGYLLPLYSILGLAKYSGEADIHAAGQGLLVSIFAFYMAALV